MFYGIGFDGVAYFIPDIGMEMAFFRYPKHGPNIPLM
jgi:hypothetical protein